MPPHPLRGVGLPMRGPPSIGRAPRGWLAARLASALPQRLAHGHPRVYREYLLAPDGAPRFLVRLARKVLLRRGFAWPRPLSARG